MREVTIPEGWNPCKITVNNVVYEYPAGQTVEVPDEIAALIEQAAANQPQAKDQRQVFSLEFGPEDAGKPVAVNSDGTGVQLGGGYDLEIRYMAPSASTITYDSNSGVIVSGSFEAVANKIKKGLLPKIRVYLLGTESDRYNKTTRVTDAQVSYCEYILNTAGTDETETLIVGWVTGVGTDTILNNTYIDKDGSILVE